MQEYRSSSPLPLGKVNQLQEALTLHPDVKPRSMEWCLKLIDALFKSKRVKVGFTSIIQLIPDQDNDTNDNDIDNDIGNDMAVMMLSRS